MIKNLLLFIVTTLLAYILLSWGFALLGNNLSAFTLVIISLAVGVALTVSNLSASPLVRRTSLVLLVLFVIAVFTLVITAIYNTGFLKGL